MNPFPKYPLLPEKTYPKGFALLCDDDKIHDLVECNVLYLHTLMLEVGFISTDVDPPDAYEKMPENWRGNSVYNFSYYHKTIPDVVCCVACVPVYSNLTIFGLLEDETDEKNTVHFSFKVANPSSIFCDTLTLSTKIKDEFCFRLLALAQEKVNFQPSFGLGGLLSDCKLSILKYLSAHSLVTVSRVNKEFHNVANSPQLWKSLFFKEFPGTSNHENNLSSSEVNWKQKYKNELESRKHERARLKTLAQFADFDRLEDGIEIPFLHPPYHNDNRVCLLNLNRDPAIQHAFPQLQGRYQVPQFRVLDPRSRFDFWDF